MLTSTPRQRASRPIRHGHKITAPGTNDGAAVELCTVGVTPTEDAAGPSTRPTLDDFGGRSDALGG